MKNLEVLRKSARKFTRSFFRRQAMAVCFRERAEGVELLLVSKRTGRNGLTFPKGTVEPGESGWEAARREAFEEAGVSGNLSRLRIGTFYYCKKNRFPVIRVDAYPMRVEEMADSFPEVQFRERRWLAPAEARDLVPLKLRRLIDLAFEGSHPERQVGP